MEPSQSWRRNDCPNNEVNHHPNYGSGCMMSVEVENVETKISDEVTRTKRDGHSHVSNGDEGTCQPS